VEGCVTDSKSNSKSANIKNNAKQTAANKTNSMHEFLSNKNSTRFATNRQPVKLVSPGEKLRQPMKREATPMKQYLTTREEKIFTSNCWYIAPTYKKEHPAIFPDELCEKVLKYYSYPGDVVLDPFAGSGTFGKIALKNNRIPILCEKNVEYINYIKKNIIK